MPGGDRTGPLGRGPITGRGLGYCSGTNRPGYAIPPRYGRGFGRGRGRGYGRGFWGRGRGFWGSDYYDPYYSTSDIESYPQRSKEEEKSYLKNLISQLEDEMKMVKEKLQNLTDEQKEGSH